LQLLLQSRDDLMDVAVMNMNRADQIRELIESMRTKSQLARRPVKDLDHWVSWATHHANSIDPRYMSVKGLEAWVGKFKLKN